MVIERRVFGLKFAQYWFDEAAWQASYAHIAALRCVWPGPKCDARWQENTLTVDLSGEESHWLALFASRARASIRQADRSIQIKRLLSKVDRDAFYLEYQDFAKRRGLLIPKPEEEAHLEVFMAYQAEKVIYGAAFLPVTSELRYRYRYGMTIAKSQAGAAVILQAMRRAKELGLVRFDLGGVSGGPNSGESTTGIDYFKTQFGGKPEAIALCFRTPHFALRGLLNALALIQKSVRLRNTIQKLSIRSASNKAGTKIEA